MIEQARKHGAFDSRYASPQPRAIEWPAGARAALSEEENDHLDWDAFSARYFPDSRRHDLNALAAYSAYRNGSAGRAGSALEDADAHAAASIVRAGEAGVVATILGVGRAKADGAAAAAVQAWESEGGAATLTARRSG